MFYPIILGIHSYGMCIALLMLVASELLLVAARRGHATPARVALHASRCAGTLFPWACWRASCCSLRVGGRSPRG
jgi:hypothetical protein